MSLLGTKQGPVASPLQASAAQLATDVCWMRGTIESRGDPHQSINRDDFDYFKINDAQITPWNFTGLPHTHTAQLMINRQEAQLLLFDDEETIAQYREPPQTAVMMLYFPLFVIRGAVPIFGEARMENFTEFWKGLFLPISNAAIHFLAENSLSLPTKVPLVYVNRNAIRGYFQV